jgi:ferredoxin-NADP reductase
MPRYKVSLHARETLCAGTTAFYFEKPEGFKFEAGQFANFALLTPPGSDLKGHTRVFSIASAPHEKTLMVATRLRATDFKRTLNSLPIGTELHLQGPYGSMTLPKDSARTVVLMAGGIGITPFRSLVWNATESLSPCRIFLFYSVRVPEEAAFLEELQETHLYGHAARESEHALAGRDRANHSRNAIEVDSGSQSPKLLHCGPSRDGSWDAPNAFRLRNLRGRHPCGGIRGI